jgi:hypothetical protein
LVSTHTDKLTDDTLATGAPRHPLEREIVTGIGAVAVVPSVRDRVGEGGEHIRFSSTILPPMRADEEPRGADPDSSTEGHLHR